MPIIDVEIVCESETAFGKFSAQSLADVIGKVLGSEPGRVWVRLQFLNCNFYAENLSALQTEQLPVFVTVLHAHLPAGDALTAEIAALTNAVADCVDRSPLRVHVQYAPPAAGRQAFGGKMVV
jgi:phenylpyruvate tautomerase PptA (4-oxalocrotonate tautomerase family)